MKGSRLSWPVVALSALLLLMTGCSSAIDSDTTKQPNTNADSGEQGIGVTAAALKKSKAVAVKFKIYKAHSCKSKPAAKHKKKKLVDKEIRPLNPLTLDKFDSFDGKPFSKKSEHHFADFFSTRKAGCYHVKAIALKKKKHSGPKCNSGCGKKKYKPIKKCSPAIKKYIKVRDGETTEKLLIIQCKGKKRGGLDVIGSINHAPTIKHIKYHRSKFMQCGRYGVICAKFHDPDDDPLKAKWSMRPKPHKGPKVVPAKLVYKCKNFCRGKQRPYRCMKSCFKHHRKKRKRKCHKRCKRRCKKYKKKHKRKNCYKRRYRRCKRWRKVKGYGQCIVFKPWKTGPRRVKVKVKDYVWSTPPNNTNNVSGKHRRKRLISVEKWIDLHQDQYKDVESRDKMTFPLYVGGQCQKPGHGGD